MSASTVEAMINNDIVKRRVEADNVSCISLFGFHHSWEQSKISKQSKTLLLRVNSRLRHETRASYARFDTILLICISMLA